MNGSMRDAPPATMYTSAGGSLSSAAWETEWSALTAHITELTAALESLRAERDRALLERDTIQVLADDCTKDLGHAMADMLDLRDRHNAVSAERERLAAELAVRSTDAKRMQERLSAETLATAELAARLSVAEAEVVELRLLLQQPAATRRALFGRGGRPAARFAAAKPPPRPPAQATPAPEAVEAAVARRLLGGE